MGRRRRSREAAFQILFSRHFTGLDSQAAVLHHGLIESKEAVVLDEFGAQLLERLDEKHDEVEKAIVRALQHWDLDRLSAFDRALLYLGTAELLFFPDIPPRVTINEYIELSKRYGDDDSPRFLNGVLDRVRSDFESRVGMDASGST